ncbi:MULTISPECIES: hypothetical protein [Streptomyces]|uniref:hypothetical protein n=1 Tax=Streptomyces TaxID=1883 RepID=UPI0004BDAF2D|nr:MULTISPECIES: hypothetical protein [Streptomyces]KJY20598.1 hypothetical protein VR43_14845 [Streptomyces sp. NRRL S-104]KOU38683.1 hypothetical protein ADK53_12420 [Streptomyces sp. WM6373]KOU60565.1 hypothetical protein ADK96_30745 [Streptomyces sp. IGB124]KOU79162.1 hypothetical protein ADK61_11865 [Streptomyces sp. XY66]KOV25620.1 hypothetical protein ADK90_06310 [Streptomyces sp. XY413]
MASKRAGASPADTYADGEDRVTPWSDFQRVLDQMFGLLEGVEPDDGASRPGTAPRRRPATGGGTG